MAFYIGAYIAFSLSFSILYFELVGDRSNHLVAGIQFLGGVLFMIFPVFFLNSGLHLFDVYWEHVIIEHYILLLMGLLSAVILFAYSKFFWR